MPVGIAGAPEFRVVGPGEERGCLRFVAEALAEEMDSGGFADALEVADHVESTLGPGHGDVEGAEVSKAALADTLLQ